MIKYKKLIFDNQQEYNSFLEEVKIPNEFYILNRQKFNFGKKIVFLVKNSIFPKFIRKTKLIGYCIIENSQLFPNDFRPFFKKSHHIPYEVLKDYPIIISDFMINRFYRNMGNGKKFANYILSDVLSNNKVSLYADRDGLYFWNKLNFKFIGDGQVMVRDLKEV